MLMKKPRQLIVFILFIIISLSVVRVGIESSISTTGAELLTLQKKAEEYRKANSILEEKYLENSSLTKLSQVARKKGYVEAKNQLYFSTPLPLALNQ